MSLGIGKWNMDEQDGQDGGSLATRGTEMLDTGCWILDAGENHGLHDLTTEGTESTEVY